MGCAVLAAAIVPGVLIGAALGLLGGGGSVLTVPIFVYVLGFSPKEAIAMSLAVVAATSAFGTVGYWRAGHVNVRIATVFGGVAMLGTLLGVRLARFIPGTTQMIIFGAVMLAAAVFMLRGRPPCDEKRGEGVARSVASTVKVVAGWAPCRVTDGHRRRRRRLSDRSSAGADADAPSGGRGHVAARHYWHLRRRIAQLSRPREPRLARGGFGRRRHAALGWPWEAICINSCRSRSSGEVSPCSSW